MMYVCIVNCDELPLVQRRFEKVELVTTMARTRRDVPIQAIFGSTGCPVRSGRRLTRRSGSNAIDSAT